MLRTMRLAACLLVVSFWVNAQSVDARLTFEVASVKPSEAPEGPIPGFGRAIGGPGSNSPGQFTSTGMSLRRLLFQIAYNFKDYQYAAPAWMDKERYDVVAKVPPGITRDQFRVMLQNLLIDRFKITSHHEQREVTMYDLVVVKGGPKMKPSTVDPKAALAGPGPGGSLHLERDADGFPAIPAGSGPMTLGTGANGQSVLVTNKSSMEQLVDQLSSNLNQPVIDKTELKGDWAFLLHYAAAGSAPNRNWTAASSDAPGVSPLDIDVAPTLFTALQSQLGLKLEQRKGPVDVLVIDYAEKTPIEN